MLRRRWIVAIGLSLAAHAGLVLALTPQDPDLVEAGSGAGSSVIGSVDAIIGIDMPVETLTEPQPTDVTDPNAAEETPPVETDAEPVTTEVAALEAAEARPVQPQEYPSAPPTEATPVESAAVEPQAASSQPVETAAAEPREVATEPVEVAALTPLEATTAPPVEADLAAAPTVTPASEPVAAAASPASDTPEIDAAAPTTEAQEVNAAPTVAAADVAEVKPGEPATSVQEPAAETTAPAQPAKELAAADAEAIEAIEATEPPPRKTAQPAEKPKRLVAKLRQRIQERRAERAAAPPRGSSDVANVKGAEEADDDSAASDPGRGRSQEAGRGAALASSYASRVSAKIRRARRYPAGTDARGTAHVAFSIGGGGAINGLRVVASSGDPLLDRAALEMVRRAAPFPPPPVAGFGIRVPIELKPAR